MEGSYVDFRLSLRRRLTVAFVVMAGPLVEAQGQVEVALKVMDLPDVPERASVLWVLLGLQRQAALEVRKGGAQVAALAVHEADVVERAGEGVAVPRRLREGKGPLLGGQGPLEVPLPAQDDSLVAHHAGLVLPQAQLAVGALRIAEGGQGRLEIAALRQGARARGHHVRPTLAVAAPLRDGGGESKRGHARGQVGPAATRFALPGQRGLQLRRGQLGARVQRRPPGFLAGQAQQRDHRRRVWIGGLRPLGIGQGRSGADQQRRDAAECEQGGPRRVLSRRSRPHATSDG